MTEITDMVHTVRRKRAKPRDATPETWAFASGLVDVR